MQFFKDKPEAALALCLRVEDKLTFAYLMYNDSLKHLKDANERILELKEEAREKILELKAEKLAQKQEWTECRKDWAEHKSLLLADGLRSRGLLTAQGVFERYLQLIAIENNVKGKFNATEVCKLLKVFVPKLASWTEIFVLSIGTAVPGRDVSEYATALYAVLCRDVSEYATALYAVLCRDIHGHPWTGDGVVLIFDDTKQDEKDHLLVLQALCKGMGLM